MVVSARRGGPTRRGTLTVITLTQVAFTSPEPPPVISDIQAAAYAALTG
jgi:hypothetical protein